MRHVVADESGSCVVGLNLRACGPLDCHVLGPCLEKLLLLQHLDLSQNPDLTGDLAALNGLVYLSTLNVSDCPRITGSLQDLSGLLSVTALNVANCPGVTGVLSALAELSNLLELDVTGCPEVHGDVSALWRAVPSCVVRHEERHVPHHVDDKDDVLGAVLEEDLEELDALEHPERTLKSYCFQEAESFSREAKVEWCAQQNGRAAACSLQHDGVVIALAEGVSIATVREQLERVSCEALGYRQSTTCKPLAWAAMFVLQKNSSIQTVWTSQAMKQA